MELPKMNDIDHIPDNVLKELAKGSHPPVEMLQAYAREELNADSYKKVSGHLDACQECTALLSRINDMLKEEKDFVSHEPEANEKMTMPPAIAEKARLVATLNAVRDELVEDVAKVLLPQNAWHIITPILLVIANKDRFSSPTETRQISDVLHKAAFAAGNNVKDKDKYEKVFVAIKLVDAVLLLLTERCESLKDIRLQLSDCVETALATQEHTELSDEDKRAILAILQEKLNIDEE
jgi:hypothetical protein